MGKHDKKKKEKKELTARQFFLRLTIISSLLGSPIPVNVEFNDDDKPFEIKKADESQESIDDTWNKGIRGKIMIIAFFLIWAVIIGAFLYAFFVINGE